MVKVKIDSSANRFTAGNGRIQPKEVKKNGRQPLQTLSINNISPRRKSSRLLVAKIHTSSNIIPCPVKLGSDNLSNVNKSLEEQIQKFGHTHTIILHEYPPDRNSSVKDHDQIE